MLDYQNYERSLVVFQIVMSLFREFHLLVYSFNDTLAIFIRTELPPGGSLIAAHHVGTMLANGNALPYLSFESIVLYSMVVTSPPVNHIGSRGSEW